VRDATPLSITHVICSDAFAGVERYVTDVALQQVTTGDDLTVLGGDATAMTLAFDGSAVTWRPAPSVTAAWRHLRRPGPDVIHVHMTAAEIAAITTRPLHRAPIVATLHFAQPRGHGHIRPLLYRPLPRFLDAQVAISQFVADQSKGSADVILNGVPWGIPRAEREHIVLMAQRHEPEKDSSTALRAWGLSGLAADGWRLDIAGDGSQHDELVRLVGQLGLSDSVRFLGFVPDVRERMARASMFLATAPAEPFGLSVVEAMAAGTPVVAAAAGAHLETVGRVSTEHLFAAGSIEGCGAALRALGNDEATRQTYGSALEREWEATFTIERHCSQLDAVYRRLNTDR
jgi:glycosyltransferase involved in cell wall biosynthesis